MDKDGKYNLNSYEKYSNNNYIKYNLNKNNE